MSVLSRISSLARFSKCHTQHYTFIRGFKPKKSGTEVKIEPVPQNTAGPQFTPISKYLLYTAMVVPTTFTGCVIWHYESVRKITQNRINPMKERQRKEGNLRDHINLMWNSISPGKKVAIGIISANIATFLLWKFPSRVPFLSRYFTCCPTNGHSVVSSTLSAFSHQSGTHLFVNMYVLWSFSDILVKFMGKEQFLAIYLGAATFSGMASSVLKVARRSMIPSVGASGAIMCMLAIFCKTFPDAGLQIAIVGDFFPHSFKASSALIGVILLDCTGILMRWRVLDHAGHLGGVMFGLAYAYLVKAGYISKMRRSILDTWHGLRK